MRFPLYSTYNEIKTNWVKFTPYAEFGEGAAPGQSVLLPATQGISIDEGANYNSVDMGPIGKAVGDALRGGSNVKDLESAKNITANAEEDVKSKAKSLWGMDSLGNVMSFLLSNKGVDSGGVQAAGVLHARRVVNPHTSSFFTNVNVRSFSFSFSLIASSVEERDAIKQIVEHFRVNLYPEASEGGLFSKFPPTWSIGFFYGTGASNGTQLNQYIPKIHRCFLQSMNTVYNSSANSFHADGSPFDVTVALGFTETKTYSQSTILNGEGTL